MVCKLQRKKEKLSKGKEKKRSKTETITKTSMYLEKLLKNILLLLLLLLLSLLWQNKRLDAQSKNKKNFGWAANRNQPQHRLKFVIKKVYK